MLRTMIDIQWRYQKKVGRSIHAYHVINSQIVRIVWQSWVPLFLDYPLTTCLHWLLKDNWWNTLTICINSSCDDCWKVIWKTLPQQINKGAMNRTAKLKIVKDSISRWYIDDKKGYKVTNRAKRKLIKFIQTFIDSFSL